MRIYNQLDWWSFQKADQVLTSSAAFVGELIRKNVQPDHILVQHMPIRAFAPAQKNKKRSYATDSGSTSGPVFYFALGAFRTKKDTLIVRAFPKMRELAGDSQLHLVLVGEGPERRRIEELCHSLNLTELVTLTGQQDDINPYYGIAEVFLLPSLE